MSIVQFNFNSLMSQLLTWSWFSYTHWLYMFWWTETPILKFLLWKTSDTRNFAEYISNAYKCQQNPFNCSYGSTANVDSEAHVQLLLLLCLSENSHAQIH